MENLFKWPARQALKVLVLTLAYSVPFQTLQAQVSNYGFRSTMGTYVPITGGTVLTPGGGWNNEVFTVTLPSSFFFDGAWYTTMYVSCNGFITFGSAPSGTNYAPLSSAETYSGAIAAFGCNLRATTQPTAAVRWEQIGDEVVVQWKQTRRAVPTNEIFDLQIRLNLYNGVIKAVYGAVQSIGQSELGFPQVGLRGADNAFPTNVNNLLIDAGANNNWLYPLKGAAATDRCRFTAKPPAKKTLPGLTYTWTWASGMELELQTDAFGAQTTWSIVPNGGGPAVCSGSGYASNSTIVLACLPPPGSYRLIVEDSQGNGMCCANGAGGYVLRDLNGATIIDNRNDGEFGTTSTVTLPFDMPLGTTHVTDSTCSIEDKFTEHWVQALPDEAVRAEFGIGPQNDDGYQWWFFNPDGGYQRRLLITHASNNYQFWYGVDRCSYLRLGHVVSSPLPLNVLLNMKVRTCVNGTYGRWGKACRLRIDLPDLCPAVQLIDDPANPKHSCGITNVYLNSSRWLHATFIPTAHKYKFQFTAPGYTRNITTTGSAVLMAQWAVNPLQYGPRTYNVKVTTSYDNGSTWCPWGPECTITTAAGPPQGRMGSVERSTELSVFPTVVNDGQYSVVMNGLSPEVASVELMLVSGRGEVVLRRTIEAADGSVNDRSALPASVAPGRYVLVLLSGDDRWTRSLIVN